MHIPFLGSVHNACKRACFYVCYGMCARLFDGKEVLFGLAMRWYNPASGFHKDRGRKQHLGNGTINGTMKWRASFAAEGLSTLKCQITTSVYPSTERHSRETLTAHLCNAERSLACARFCVCQAGCKLLYETGHRNNSKGEKQMPWYYLCLIFYHSEYPTKYGSQRPLQSTAL